MTTVYKISTTKPQDLHPHEYLGYEIFLNMENGRSETLYVSLHNHEDLERLQREKVKGDIIVVGTCEVFKVHTGTYSYTVFEDKPARCTIIGISVQCHILNSIGYAGEGTVSVKCPCNCGNGYGCPGCLLDDYSIYVPRFANFGIRKVFPKRYNIHVYERGYDNNVDWKKAYRSTMVELKDSYITRLEAQIASMHTLIGEISKILKI